MRVSVIGAGYVGIVTAACLAEMGHSVVCVDVDSAKIDMINRAATFIHEAGLDKLIRNNVPNRLTATTDLRRAVMESEVSLICVGTPWDGVRADLTYVKAAAQGIGEALRERPGYHVVVVKSTVPPGTTDGVVRKVIERASQKSAGDDFGVGMNPEFLTEGEAVHDFMNPDRIVLGGMDERCREILDRLYAGFEGVQRLRTDNATAEMIKYTSNALLATLISFSNEIANLCVAMRTVDVTHVMRGVHVSRYFTTNLPNGERLAAPITSFLWAGCGFGGSCLPKDVNALIAHGKDNETPMLLLEAVRNVNQRQPHQVVARLTRHFQSLKGVRTTILGLAFRPGTDDMRESPAIPIIHDLLAEGATLKAYDPVAGPQGRELFNGQPVLICSSLAEAIEDAQAIVLVTLWDEFQSLPTQLGGRTPPPLVFDCRRMLDPARVARYDGIGFTDPARTVRWYEERLRAGKLVFPEDTAT